MYRPYNVAHDDTAPHSPRFGAHMSIAGEPANALRAGKSIGCDTIQMFTRSPNRWAGRR